MYVTGIANKIYARRPCRRAILSSATPRAQGGGGDDVMSADGSWNRLMARAGADLLGVGVVRPEVLLGKTSATRSGIV